MTRVVVTIESTEREVLERAAYVDWAISSEVAADLRAMGIEATVSVQLASFLAIPFIRQMAQEIDAEPEAKPKVHRLGDFKIPPDTRVTSFDLPKAMTHETYERACEGDELDAE